MAIAFAADYVFAPPSECACALAIDRGGILAVKVDFHMHQHQHQHQHQHLHLHLYPLPSKAIRDNYHSSKA